jgi:hypothetical protein
MPKPDPEQVVLALLTAPNGLRAAGITRRLKWRISQDQSVSSCRQLDYGLRLE